MTRLEGLYRTSDAGALIERVRQLEFWIETFHMTLDDITAEEAVTLRIFTEERLKAKLEEDRQNAMDNQLQATMKR